MMRAELVQDGAECIATYTVRDGVAVREGGPDWLDDVRVTEPGNPPTLVLASEGERYLRALPAAFTGARLRAKYIEQGGH
jgi:hypothetical protein